MYGSVSGHRSAISAYHTQINNIAIVEHPKLCALTGIFNKRPPKARFCFVWDIKKVLNHLNEFAHNLNLPINLLSQKLVLLIALTAASRRSGIC